MTLKSLVTGFCAGALCFGLSWILISSAISILHSVGSYDTFRDNISSVMPIGIWIVVWIVTILIMRDS